MNGTNRSEASDLPDLNAEEEARCEELIAELTDPSVRCALLIEQVLSRLQCHDQGRMHVSLHDHARE